MIAVAIRPDHHNILNQPPAAYDDGFDWHCRIVGGDGREAQLPLLGIAAACNLECAFEIAPVADQGAAQHGVELGHEGNARGGQAHGLLAVHLLHQPGGAHDRRHSERRLGAPDEPTARNQCEGAGRLERRIEALEKAILLETAAQDLTIFERGLTDRRSRLGARWWAGSRKAERKTEQECADSRQGPSPSTIARRGQFPDFPEIEPCRAPPVQQVAYLHSTLVYTLPWATLYTGLHWRPSRNYP